MKFSTKSAEHMLRQVKRGMRSHSPEIKLACGIAGIAISTYLFCKGAVKAEKVKQEFSETHEQIQSKYGPLPKKPQTDEEKATNHEYHKEMALAYRKAAFGFFKCYGLPTTIMVTSLGAGVLSSHIEMRNRNTGLAAALSASQSVCNQLRNAVRNKYGEQAEQELVNGITEETKTVTSTDENGKKVKEKETVKKWNGESSPYCFEFSPETNKNNCRLHDIPEYRHMFIDGAMKSIEDRLQTKDFATVYQALEALGYDMRDYQKKEFITMGWSNAGRDEEDPNHVRWVIHDVMKHYETGDQPICLIEMFIDDAPVYA